MKVPPGVPRWGMQGGAECARLFLMTRTEAINTIAANLSRLGEEELTTLVEVTTSWVQPAQDFKLTDTERAAVERSREDFKAGRTLSLDEAEARTDTFLAARRAARGTS